MTDQRPDAIPVARQPFCLTGLDLRYPALLQLADATRPLTLDDLAEAIESSGFRISTFRPSTGGFDSRPRDRKTLGDALRWEVRRGRVQRAPLRSGG